MASALRTLRGALAFFAVLFWFLVNAPLVYLVLLPLVLLWGQQRRAITTWFVRYMSRGILVFLRLGGARFAWRGELPTDRPALVLMNHQSQIDIVVAALMCRPDAPVFVPRARYTHWYIPVVAPAIYMLECPVVDPKRDVQGAVDAMRRAVMESDRVLLVFPEGHRSLDGEIRPFKSAGTLACLEARRLPVYLVVTDGVWAGRRLVDFLSAVPHLRGETEVLGPFEPPAANEELPAFLERARERMIQHLRDMRRRRGGA